MLVGRHVNRPRWMVDINSAMNLVDHPAAPIRRAEPRHRPVFPARIRSCPADRHLPEVLFAGSTLIELVIVAAIIGLVAAIAIPRMSDASRAASEAALRSSLRDLRQAIETYWAEHDATYPCFFHGATYNGISGGALLKHQLTSFTSPQGAPAGEVSVEHYLGPYLRAIPPLPVGKARGATQIWASDAFNGPPDHGTTIGWEYSISTGEIRSNTGPAEIGSSGIPYYQW